MLASFVKISKYKFFQSNDITLEKKMYVETD